MSYCAIWLVPLLIGYHCITSYPISSGGEKMAERFAKVNEQEIRELLDNITPKIPCLST